MDITTTLQNQVLRYSEVWEDEGLLRRGLQVKPGERVLSIASAGSNLFSLLLDDPREVLALDLNPAQLAMVALKIQGIQRLGYEEYLTLLGLPEKEPQKALALYRELAPFLGPRSQTYWEGNEEMIAAGLFGCGRLDRYFQGFRDEVLSLFFDESRLEALFSAQELEEQKEIFYAGFTPEFQNAFQEYFGREKMAQRGRSEAQFRYVKPIDVGAVFLERFERICTTDLVGQNYYLHRFLRGNYRDHQALPEYLRKENYEVLRERVSRIRLVEQSLLDHLKSSPPGEYDRVNLSDVFEYMSQEESEETFALLEEALKEGGRFAYWNLLIHREPLRDHKRLQEVLLAPGEESLDRAWFYRSFHVYEISGEGR